MAAAYAELESGPVLTEVIVHFSRQLSSLTAVLLGTALGIWASSSPGVRVFAQNTTPNATAPAPAVPAAPKPALAIDLSGNKSASWPVDPGTYRVVLYNVIPGMKYVIRAGAAEVAEIPALVLPTGTALPGMPTAAGSGATGGCQQAVNLVSTLFTTDDESTVPGQLQKIRALATNCTPDQTKYIDSVLAQSVFESGVEVQMPNDARRTVTVSRGPIAWNVELSTLLRGRVQTLFGWTFAPNQDEEYFSDAGPNNQFTIKRRTARKTGFTNLPSVFFTWLPSNQAFSTFQHYLTLGLGVTAGDTATRPSFLAGYMARWNQNFGLVSGVAVYPHRRLDGKYAENQPISANLDSNQLNKNEWRANLFFGGVFRFGSDPRKAPAAAGTGKQ